MGNSSFEIKIYFFNKQTKYNKHPFRWLKKEYVYFNWEIKNIKSLISFVAGLWT